MSEKLQQAFETIIQQKPVKLHFLQNKNIRVGICNYGARISHFIVDTENGEFDIVLGFNSIDGYLSRDNEFYYGVTVGRFANRIAGAKFVLNDETYSLDANNGGNCLHSGSTAFHNKVWNVVDVKTNSICLSLTSANGECGFPGNLTCNLVFTLTDENELIINYSAKSDADTVINLTNHAYFNLNGEGSGTILDHSFCINADTFVPINRNCIPKGDFADVSNTAFDFREPKSIADHINGDDEQLKYGNGFDHSFSINKAELINFAASAKGDQSGLTLEVYTTQPGMQFYTGNYLNGDVGKSGEPYNARTGFCFETQYHPDSPNQPNFPSTVLKAGDHFKSTTVYKVV